MRENGAVRGDYAKLEQLNKELKEELKNKTLNYEKLESSFKDLENVLLKKDGEIEELIFKVITETEKELFERKGKNVYITNREQNIRITVNQNTFRVITVDLIDK